MENTNQPQNTDLRSRHERESFQPQTNQMSMIEAVKSVFNNYANFTGRARRSEYWYWYLFTFLAAMVLYIPLIIGIITETEVFLIIGGILLASFVLAIIVPTYAVIARRLHDTGRSGWFYFISLIPLVGGIILLIWLIEDSKDGANQWGPNPKGLGNNDFNANQF